MTDFLISLKRSMIATFPFTKRLIDTTTSDRCDNAKLGKMRSDRIDHRSLLTDEEMARAMEHLNAASTTPAATAIALHNRNSGSLRKLPISS
jgi:hypothetical protein